MAKQSLDETLLPVGFLNFTWTKQVNQRWREPIVHSVKCGQIQMSTVGRAHLELPCPISIPCLHPGLLACGTHMQLACPTCMDLRHTEPGPLANACSLPWLHCTKWRAFSCRCCSTRQSEIVEWTKQAGLQQNTGRVCSNSSFNLTDKLVWLFWFLRIVNVKISGSAQSQEVGSNLEVKNWRCVLMKTVSQLNSPALNRCSWPKNWDKLQHQWWCNRKAAKATAKLAATWKLQK